MNGKIEDSLRKKGWIEEDIEKVKDLLYSDDKVKKHEYYKKEMNKIVYWSALLVLTVVNLVIAVVLIPFLMFFTSSFAMYSIIIIIALVFGSLVNILVTDIEHIEKKHHLFALIFIPIIGLITFILSVNIATGASRMLDINLNHNPFYIGIVYVVAFIIPYIISNRNNLFGENRNNKN